MIAQLAVGTAKWHEIKALSKGAKLLNFYKQADGILFGEKKSQMDKISKSKSKFFSSI